MNYIPNPFRRRQQSVNEDSASTFTARDQLSVFQSKKSEKSAKRKKNERNSQIPGILEFGTIHIESCSDSSDTDNRFQKIFNKKQSSINPNTSHTTKKHKKQDNTQKTQTEYSEVQLIENSSTEVSSIMIPRDKISVKLDLRDADQLHTLDLADDIIMPPKAAVSKGKKKESESEPLSTTFTLPTIDNNDLSQNKGKKRSRKRHTKAPKLAYDPAPATTDSYVPTNINGKITRELAYQVFYNTHKDEISTPEEIEQFIDEYIRKNYS